MFNKRLVIILILAGALSINASAKNDRKLESLYSAQFTDKYVIIEVKSTGCTRPEHFSLLFDGKAGVDYSVMRIVRDKPDRCRAMPRIISLHLELPGALAALKEPYKVENLFVSKGRN